MTGLLPVGAYVRVTEPDSTFTPWGGANEVTEPGRAYIGKVVGYDMGRSKYQIGARYGGWGEWLFMDGGSWAFPAWCVEISEVEATQLGGVTS